MNKGSVFRLLMGLCLLAFLAGAAFVGYTVISPHQAAASHATCQTTQVTLHGSAAPTISCLDGQKGAARTRIVRGYGPLAQLAIQTGCDDDALILYKDAYQSGATLCINGSGLFNLTWVSGWNDQVSSWWTGCYNVLFFQDINEEGGIAEAQGSNDGESSPFGNFPYYEVGNDQLSSVYQFGSYGGDDCVA